MQMLNVLFITNINELLGQHDKMAYLRETIINSNDTFIKFAFLRVCA